MALRTLFDVHGSPVRARGLSRDIHSVNAWLAQGTQLVGGCTEFAPNEGAIRHLRHGAGRRFGQLRYCFNRIEEIFPLDRTLPLQSSEQSELSVLVNAFFVHLRGVADNIAWSLWWCISPGMAKEDEASPAPKVSLFHKPIRAFLASRLRDEDQSRVFQWLADLKEKRDPIAHRIPAYIPPAGLNIEQTSEYQHIFQLAMDAAATHDFEASSALYEQLNSLGSALPWIAFDSLHDKIYPLHATLIADAAGIVDTTSMVLRAALLPADP